MGETTQEDYGYVVASFVLTAMVFGLDVILPLGIVIWVLYLLPLGVSSWCSIQWFSYILAVTCSILIIAGYYYSPPGISTDIAIMNRVLGILMVWIAAFFLKFKR